MGYFGYVVMVLWIFQVWMYKYFEVGLEIQEEVAGIFPVAQTSFVYTLQVFLEDLTLSDWQPDNWWCEFFLSSPF